MIVDLEVPFVDAGVSSLRYFPSAPALPVLAELDHADLVPGGHLSLRLLGASHQAVLALPGGEYAETLACVDGGGHEELPARRSVSVGPWQCRLHIEVDYTSPERLAAICHQMRRYAAHDDPRRSLYASFPGHPLAATFLRIHPGVGRPAWTTAHVYPEASQRVVTRTEIQREAM